MPEGTSVSRPWPTWARWVLAGALVAAIAAISFWPRSNPDAPGTARTTGTSARPSQETVVYVTHTGKKYHRDGCKWLKSKKALSLAKARAAGYEPCKVCRPPTE